MRAEFNRAANTMSANGVSVKRNGDSDVLLPLCRALVEAGTPDGPMEVYDETGMRCLLVRSIHRAAKLAYGENFGRGPHLVRYMPFDPARRNSAPRHTGKQHSSEIAEAAE